MKKFLIPVLVIALLGAFAGAAVAALPGGPFSSAFRVQNLSSTTANCTYSFYDASGSPAYTSSISPINAGDSLYVYVPSISGLANGQYSGVVSCDQDVAAVVNFSDPNSGSAFTGIGTADTGTTLYAPAVYNNYYNFYSNMYVQNASSSPINVTVQIFAPGGTTPVATQSTTNLAPNATFLFEQAGLAGLNPNVSYSAIIQSTGAAATVVNFYGGVGTAAQYQLYSYDAFKSGSTTAYTPVIENNYYTFNSAVSIMNIGSATTPYTVTYGTGQMQTGTLLPNSSVSLYTPVSGIPSGNSLGLNSATITSQQPVVVLVNLSNNNRRATSYTGFAAGAPIARAPIVMSNYYQFDTSVTCQNLGSLATTLQITYANNPTHPTSSTSVNPGKTFLFYQPADPNMQSGNANGITSATINASGGQPVACVVNEDSIPALSGVLKDNLYSYDAITR